MGLLEKRAMKAAIEGWLPKRQAESNDLCGGEVPLEVDWDTFASDEKGIKWLEHNGPHQVNCAFRRLCTDDLGKEAIREQIKKVVFRNVTDTADKQLSFEDGILSLHCAFGQSPGGSFKDAEIRKLLEENL